VSILPTYSRISGRFPHKLGLHTDTGKQIDDCFVMHPYSPSRGRSTDISVTVAVSQFLNFPFTFSRKKTGCFYQLDVLAVT